MVQDAQPVRVVDNPDRHRFEIYLAETLAGHAVYRLGDGEIIFVHTEIDPNFEGRGLAGRLVAAALDSARERALAVVPVCPYVSGYIAKHPEYKDLVAP
jgi:predicted GNAT family acetyltransferase